MADTVSGTQQPTQPVYTTETAPVSANRPPDEDTQEEQGNSRIRWYAIGGAAALILLFTLTTIGLYLLGDDTQSALERLRDIAVIYIVFMSLVLVVLMGGITAALIFLILQIRDQVIPLLRETNATLHRVRGTTEFVSEEAVRPIITVAGKAAQLKAMIRVATGTKK
jgi:hypothetical protein